ncbi:chemotaxis protein CheA [uncultured Algimonas sp.]|uniref:chemotaxis protein CheA n=1 Tax=uncultured Algimonas sp. TaxID=1547920 RepID=UPI00262BC0D7|nr:chemotaxis protein CheA [uncultured Algimonas sp.]
MELGDEIRDIFFLECADLLAELNGKLADIQGGASDVEDLNAVFRAVHSIKGGAGSFDLPDLVGFAHIFENVLDLLRSGKAEIDDEVTELLLQSADILTDLVEWSQSGTEIDPDSYKPTLSALEAYESSKKSDDDADAEIEDFVFAPMALDIGGPGPIDLPDLGLPLEPTPTAGLTLKFAPSAALYKAGLNAFRLLEDLMEAGAQDLQLHDDGLPDRDAFDPQEVYLYWTMRFPPDVARSTVEDLLFFAADKCELEFTEEALPAAPPPLPDLPLPDLSEAVTGAAAEAVTEAEISVPDLPSLGDPVDDPEGKETGETGTAQSEADQPANGGEPSEGDEVKAEKADDATKKAAAASTRKAPPATIRVVLDKIDRLINQVGELVITQAMLDETITEAGLERDPTVMSTINDFRQLTIDIQESVMAIRAQPIRSLFQRMGRVVRESAQKVGKNAKLVLDGEFTEVDNTIIESLGDPLTHMLRNAVDHGLEKPDRRAEVGKSEVGEVRLSAAHRGGKVVIEVADDGAGVNREKVRSIAEEKGLIEPGSIMSDAEIDNILFMPGFSTADSVSTLSGRGVGMDVVKRSIQDIGGKVVIRSTPGEGSCITITLPLTLAILDGMLVRVGKETLVLPLTSIVETILVSPKSIHGMGTGGRMVDVRGSLLPLIDLAGQLGFETDRAADAPTVVVIVEADGQRWCALQVDAIIDQRQVVIKSLEENFGHVDSISAATILGDGRLALIIDTEQLSDLMVSRLTEQPSTEPKKELAHG